MAYTAKVNDSVFFKTDSDDRALALSSALLKLGTSSAGTFEFTVPTVNTKYKQFDRYISYIDVYRDGKDQALFSGRVVNISYDFNTFQKIYCEGAMSYLSDSMFRPITHEGTLGELVDAIITSHNSQVEAAKRIKVVPLPLTLRNSNAYRAYEKIETSLSRIEDLVESFGGYVQVYKSSSDGLLYLEWHTGYTDANPQLIKLGDNLLDITIDDDDEDICTVLIPLGAQTESGEYIDIKSVNSGKDYIVAEQIYLDKYGYIVRTQNFEDVTIPENLKRKAQSSLDDRLKNNITISVNAVDLADGNTADAENFSIGQSLKVQSKAHGIDDFFECQEQNLDLLNPDNNTLTLGKTKVGYLKSSSDYINDRVSDVKSTLSGQMYDLKNTLSGQIDSKIETWAQDENPATAWTTSDEKIKHNGDLWYYTGTTDLTIDGVTILPSKSYQYNGSTEKWVLYKSSRTSLYDFADGKSTIYYGKTTATYSGVEVDDYLVDSTDGKTYRWDGTKWVKVTDYITYTDEQMEELQKQIEANYLEAIEKAKEDAVNDSTEAIINGTNGYVLLHDSNSDGKIDEILIMNTNSIASATKVWRWNSGGLGYSSKGYNGPYTTAINMNGQIVADFIATGSLNASLITTGTLSFNRCQGGTLTLGGSNNGYGSLVIKDASDNVIGQWNKDGAIITGDVTMHNGTIWESIGNAYMYGYYYTYGYKWTQLAGQTIWFKNGNNTYARFSKTTYGTAVCDTMITNKTEYCNIVTIAPNKTNVDDSAAPTSGVQCINHVTSVNQGNWTYYPLISNSANIIGNSTRYGYAFGENVICLGQNPHALSAAGNAQIYLDPTKMYIAGVGKIEMNSSRGYTRIINGSNIFLMRDETGSGSHTADSGWSITCAGQTIKGWGSIVSVNGTYVAYQSISSKRFKNSISKKLNEDLNPAKLYDLEVKQFKYNEDANLQYEDLKNKMLIGFIAEDVDEVYPNAIIHDEDGNVKSWDERRLLPPMLKLIQNHYQEIENLKKSINELEQKLSD